MIRPAPFAIVILLAGSFLGCMTIRAVAQETEWAEIERTFGDRAILQTRDGSRFMFEFGSGCSRLDGQDGRRVLLLSTSGVPTSSSRILVPDRSIDCRIRNPERIGGPALTLLPRPNPETGVATAAQTREAIAAAQQELARRGFDPGTADGANGPRTRLALRAFQRAMSIPQTGDFDAQTMGALGVTQSLPSAVAPNALAEGRRPAGASCDGPHMIMGNDGMGALLRLSNGVQFLVDDVERSTTMVWLPSDEVLVCGNRLMNVTQGGTFIDGRRLR